MQVEEGVAFGVYYGAGVCWQGDFKRGAMDKKCFTPWKKINFTCFMVDQVFEAQPNIRKY